MMCVVYVFEMNLLKAAEEIFQEKYVAGAHFAIRLVVSTITPLTIGYSLNERLHVKIVIGITQHPEKIPDLMKEHQGVDGSATEVGPFLSQEDAFTWRDSLKSRITSIEEIPMEKNSLSAAVYYGFTFECNN